MDTGTTIDGAEGLMSVLDILRNPDTAKKVATSAVYAGLSVVERECRSAAPGSIKQEVGKFVRVIGDQVWGRAGLVKFPRPGDGQNGPHGVYLDLGTKFITPRHFIGDAINRALPTALEAMKRAAARKIERLAAANS